MSAEGSASTNNQAQEPIVEKENSLDAAAERGSEAADQPPDADASREKLEADLAEARDQVLRAQAEIQNIRRRAERDVESASKYAIEKFSEALVPVIDNFERALSLMNAENETTRALCEGIELTHRNLLDVLKRFGIAVVDPEGEPFDPSLHEAMSAVENDEVEPNTVVQVVQKGYTLHGRVLRAAMVMVARPKAQVDETA